MRYLIIMLAATWLPAFTSAQQRALESQTVTFTEYDVGIGFSPASVGDVNLSLFSADLRVKRFGIGIGYDPKAQLKPDHDGSGYLFGYYALYSKEWSKIALDLTPSVFFLSSTKEAGQNYFVSVRANAFLAYQWRSLTVGFAPNIGFVKADLVGLDFDQGLSYELGYGLSYRFGDRISFNSNGSVSLTDGSQSIRFGIKWHWGKASKDPPEEP